MGETVEGVRVRRARLADAARCRAIYAPYVEETVISLEEEPPTVQEMENRMASSLATHDWLVLDGPDRVVGYAYGSAYRSQPVGTWRRIGWKFGAWHDVLWMQRPLAPGSEPPGEPS